MITSDKFGDVRLEWLTTLVVGGRAMDPSGTVRKIITINNQIIPAIPSYMIHLIMHHWIPRSLSVSLMNILADIFFALGKVQIVDRTITLDDGIRYSGFSDLPWITEKYLDDVTLLRNGGAYTAVSGQYPLLTVAKPSLKEAVENLDAAIRRVPNRNSRG
jgi:hypothetical protein